MPPLSDMPLTQAPLHVPLVVSRVSDRDPALLRRLDALGLQLQQAFVLRERTPYDHVLHLRLLPAGPTVVIGPRLAQAVFVRPQAAPAAPSPAQEARA